MSLSQTGSTLLRKTIGTRLNPELEGGGADGRTGSHKMASNCQQTLKRSKAVVNKKISAEAGTSTQMSK